MSKEKTIADGIKKDVSKIMMSAVSGSEPKYRNENGYIKWGLVEKDIHAKIETHLTSDSK